MYEFFKGYVETKNKRCVEKFKNRDDFKSYRQVKSLPEFAGILSQDTILIDVDDAEQSEVLYGIVIERGLNCRVYQTTRGMHFLFRNDDRVDSCRTHTNLACGIQADIKLGKRNSYSILKFDGKERKILRDCKGIEPDVVPKWLLPIKTSMEFMNMDAGDGRNTALYSYILTLQSHDFSVEEGRETIRIINDYVLKEPLSDDEIETILRDEAFAKPVFYKGSSFLFDKFAVFLKSNHYIVRINGQLHMYKNGIYVPGQDEIESAMIQHIPELNKAKRAEVMAYLNILIRDNTTPAPAHIIAFRNGLYDVKSGAFMEFNPDVVITNKIPWDYNPAAESVAMDAMLDNVSVKDTQIRRLLEEIVGACMYRSNTLAGGKAFILTGSGSNGKSTYLKALSNLLSEKNVSSLDLKSLGERFNKAMMFGKLANIGDDISNEFLCDTAIFKKIVTGETIDAEFKGMQKFDMRPFCKLLFSANTIPRMGKGSDSGAIMRRLVIVPFDARFSSSDPDFKPEIVEELSGQEAMERLIQLGIKGLRRVLEEKKYTTSEKMEEELEAYEERNNPLLSFVKDCDDEEFKIEGEATADVYNKYREFCLSESLQPLSKIEFSRQMTKCFELRIVRRKIAGRITRVFVEDEKGEENASN